MKLQILLILSMALLSAITGQQHTGCQRCRQGACRPRCAGDRNIGVRCAANAPRRMWYYDINSRTCREMPHLGCGGNTNRWCSQAICELRCVRTLG